MRMIDADPLKIDIVEEGQRSRRYKLGEIWELNRDEIYKVIDEQPTIEPERKTGRWQLVSADKYIYRCDACKKSTFGISDFCPNCGARMEGENETD